MSFLSWGPQGWLWPQLAASAFVLQGAGKGLALLNGVYLLLVHLAAHTPCLDAATGGSFCSLPSAKIALFTLSAYGCTSPPCPAWFIAGSAVSISLPTSFTFVRPSSTATVGLVSAVG